MSAWFKKYVLSDVSAAWLLKMAASLAGPVLIVLLRPLGMDLRQSATVAGILLTIIWWTTNLVKKVPASLFLLLWSLLVSGAPAKTVFAFPLGETFIMLVVTYLFSQAISNCGIVDRLLLPLLVRFAKTPVRCVLAIIIAFTATIYVIPQPMARLVLVAVVFDSFLRRTAAPPAARSVLMYAVFVFYAVVNIAFKDADLIMNYVACSVSGTDITNTEWTRAMALPTVAYTAVVLGLFLIVFRRELRDVHLTAEPGPASGFGRRERPAALVIAVTVLLWMTSGLWGTSISLFGYISANTLVTVVATGLLFALGALGKKDFAAVDVVTLVFLSAAFAIGGVMKACGAADILFGRLSGIFPSSFSPWYLVLMMLVTMALHMVLGSNTTTLSVVVPGLVLVCGGIVPPELVVYAAIVSVSFHAILPFHSVSVMVGVSSDYFPAGYVSRLGFPVTPLIFLSGVLIYLPYWRLIGLI